jgi:hypothetical protein
MSDSDEARLVHGDEDEGGAAGVRQLLANCRESRVD